MVHSPACCGLCRFMASLNLETVVEAKGYIVPANVKSCTQKTVELKVEYDNQHECCIILVKKYYFKCPRPPYYSSSLNSQVNSIYIVSAAEPMQPFLIEDASRTHEEVVEISLLFFLFFLFNCSGICQCYHTDWLKHVLAQPAIYQVEASQETDRPFPRLGQVSVPTFAI